MGTYCREMKYVLVRTYGNVKWMNKIHNIYFEWLSQAERIAKELNETDCGDGEKWICMPLNEFVGSVW